LAKVANVGVETVRYYQRCGMLSIPERVHGAIRQYSGDSLQWHHFIRRAQALGFTLDEVRTLLQLNDGSKCGTARALAEQTLQVVEERLRDLRMLRTELRSLVGQCRDNRDEVMCPLIANLCEANWPK